MTLASEPDAPRTLPRLLTAADGGRATPAFAPALIGAGLIHLLAILLAPVAPPKPEPIPETALEVLILHAAGSAVVQPLPDAALARQNRLGESPRGDAATTIRSDRAPQPRDDPAPAANETIDETRPESVFAEPPIPEEVTQPSVDPNDIARGPPAPSQQPVSRDDPAVLAARVAPTPEPRPSLETLSRRQAPADAARILASQGTEIARLTASLETRASDHANRVRRKSISASTREFRYASYLGAWARKVERIGNLNYPQAAKEEQLYGSLILHVALRSDGSVERIRVVRSSGLDLLDQAAIQIVELAAPYSPFPPDIAAETDVLDIIRTWQFMQGGVLGWER
ncbi:TonB family protein [Thiocystis violascens]|uniref:TonB family protein n=1 Tax=Thiocystis violascens (strain ATCC 17096 / DSM 198 / 6111) TaxID=765911 RepID=I3YDW5_THIV6|nr:TonB family protein [Thiocystis violascens]AFL75183.1 TonB family protein [Thiocystis violascens DSM 198]